MSSSRKVWVVRVVHKLTGQELAKYVYDDKDHGREAYESVRYIRIRQNRENVTVSLSRENDPLY